MAKGQERETFVTIAFGQMGVGKSYITEKIIKAYMRLHPNRKIMVFDPNNEPLYHFLQPLKFDVIEVMKAKKQAEKTFTTIITPSEKNIQNLPPNARVRVVPKTIYGETMNTIQMKATMLSIARNFKGGLILFEDVNKYVQNFQEEELQGCFKAVRHSSQDIIMHLQSSNPIRPIFFESASVLRMHYDGFDLYKIRARLADNYEIMKIAQIIVNYEYLEQNNTRFFCYVHHKIKKIRGISKEQFLLGCNKYLRRHPMEVKQISLEIARDNYRNSPNYNDVREAEKRWIAERMRYIQ